MVPTRSAPHSPATLIAVAAIVLASSAFAADPTGQSQTPAAPPALTQAQAQRLKEILVQTQDLIDAGRQRQAYPLLMQLKNQFGAYEHPDVQAQLALVALAENAPDKALEFVAKYTQAQEPYDSDLDAAYLAAGKALAANATPDKAMTLLDWLASKSTGTTQVNAAECVGNTAFLQKDYKRAVSSLQFAMDTLKAMGGYAPKVMLARIQDELNRARAAYDLDRYGEDFIIFRTAEAFRRQAHDYIKADAKYRELLRRFPNSAFTEPATLYDALCYLQAGKTDTGEKQLIVFCKQYPKSLYLGEAELELGRIELEDHLDPKAAEDYFAHLDTWIADARKPDAPQQDAKMNDDVKAAITPPYQKYKAPDDFGNIVKESIQPGQLLNAKTCDWYLDDLAAQGIKLETFTLFAQSKKAEALKAVERLPALDPEISGLRDPNDPSDYSRLKWAAQNGYIYAYPDELKLFPASQRVLVLLADFYFVTQEFDHCQTLCKRLLSDRTLGADQYAYVHLLLGSCLERASFGGPKEVRDAAIKEFRIAASRSGTFTQSRAALSLASLLQHSSDRAQVAEGMSILNSLASQPQGGEFVYKAGLSLAISELQAGDISDGMAILKSIPASAEPYHTLAAHLANTFGSKPQSGSSQ